MTWELNLEFHKRQETAQLSFWKTLLPEFNYKILNLKREKELID